jgi:hypothetical protein
MGEESYSVVDLRLALETAEELSVKDPEMDFSGYITYLKDRLRTAEINAKVGVTV